MSLSELSAFESGFFIKYLLDTNLKSRSEVLNQVGVLDKVDLPEGSDQFVNNIKQKITGAVNDCRLAVRSHCSVDKIRDAYGSALEKDKMGTLGWTTGAVAGLVW